MEFLNRRMMNTIVVGLVLSILSAPCIAGGPLSLNPNDPDNLMRWPNGGLNIPFNPDGVPAGGPTALALGPFTYSEAVAQVESAFARWQAIPTATATYSNNGQMPFDIDETNFAPFVQNLLFGTNIADGVSPIIFDDDGAIFLALFGLDGNSVLAFGGPDVFDANGVPVEGVLFLNGGAIWGGFPVFDFLSVMLHEIGHYSGMGHTAVNGQIVVLGDTSGPTPFNTFGNAPIDSAATMNDVVPSGAIAGGGIVTLHADDIAFFSTLYPAADFFSSTGTISGTIWAADGTTPLTGVNVIARNVINPFVDAGSAISGGRGTPGEYTIHGLTPGEEYSVHVDEIIVGEFNTPPLSPLPGPEEFYNGVDESNGTVIPDVPSEFTAVPVVAGTPAANIDIIFNEPDADSDGVSDDDDNCPADPNPLQENFDGDSEGDACDPDDDNDGLSDIFENAIGFDRLDPDSFDDDGIGDALEVELGNPSNDCSVGGDGDNAIVQEAISTNRTCAARISIDVISPPTVVTDPGHLTLIAPLATFESGFSAGRLTVISADPCPGC